MWWWVSWAWSRRRSREPRKGRPSRWIQTLKTLLLLRAGGALG
jgi:hypothetical protein